jgi:hypothetical protein
MRFLFGRRGMAGAHAGRVLASTSIALTMGFAACDKAVAQESGTTPAPSPQTQGEEITVTAG